MGSILGTPPVISSAAHASQLVPLPTVDQAHGDDASNNSSICRVHAKIDSSQFTLESNEVLAVVLPELENAGYSVESGKKKVEKVSVPVLYGENGKIEKEFQADAYHKEERIVVEVEAGRAVANNQFLKDLFQACMMGGVGQLCIAVRVEYKNQHDYDTVVKFMQTLFASNRLQLPLSSIVIIGY